MSNALLFFPETHYTSRSGEQRRLDYGGIGHRGSASGAFSFLMHWETIEPKKVICYTAIVAGWADREAGRRAQEQWRCAREAVRHRCAGAREAGGCAGGADEAVRESGGRTRRQALAATQVRLDGSGIAAETLR